MDGKWEDPMGNPEEDELVVVVARRSAATATTARRISLSHLAERHIDRATARNDNGEAGGDSRRTKGHSQQEAHRGWPVAWT